MANLVTNPIADQSIESHNLLPAPSNTTQSLGTSAAPWNAVLSDCNVIGSLMRIVVPDCTGDFQLSGGASIQSGSTSLTVTGSGPFASTDVGKDVYVQGAGASGTTLATTIAAWVSNSEVTLTAAASTSVADSTVGWGTDCTPALQAAYATMLEGGSLYIPAGNYLHHGLNWTGNQNKIYGAAWSGTTLTALRVTNPGQVNDPGTKTVGVDMTDSWHNEVRDITFYTFPVFADLAPYVNVLAGSGIGGNPTAIMHIFDNCFFSANGPYNVALYGYEQCDFINCHFETQTSSTEGNLYISANNTPAFIGPYVTLCNPTTSMTKVNISGARTVFSGTGKMIVLDQGLSESNYSISIRDAYSHMGSNSVFLSDTGPVTPSGNSGTLRHVVLDTINIESTSGATNCAAITINGACWNWRIANVQIYVDGGLTVSPFSFTNGYLDGEVLVDFSGQASGSLPGFSTSSAAGSILHLGEQQPTTNATDYAYLSAVRIKPSMNLGSLVVSANGSEGYIPIGAFLAPQLSAGNVAQLFLGVAEASNNCIVEEFIYAGGNGSSSNYVNWSLYGNVNNMSFDGNGVLTVPSVNASSLVVSANGSEGYIPIGAFLAPQLSAGNVTQLFLGVTEASNNCIVQEFIYAGGNGSSSNYVNWSLYGNANNMSFDGNGVLTVPSLSLNGHIHQGSADCQGNISSSDGTAISKTYNVAYAVTPTVVVTPTTDSGAFYLSASSETGFTITYANSGAQTFNYFVIGNPS